MKAHENQHRRPATIGLTGAALAASITPDRAFQADGNANLTKSFLSLPCTAHFVGNVSGGVGHVTSARFTGGPAGACSSVTATNLPWPVTPISATTGPISGVAVNTPIGNCTLGTLTGSYNNSVHVLTFSRRPGAAVDCSAACLADWANSSLPRRLV